jgi:hypothetical protein
MYSVEFSVCTNYGLKTIPTFQAPEMVATLEENPDRLPGARFVGCNVNGRKRSLIFLWGICCSGKGV